MNMKTTNFRRFIIVLVPIIVAAFSIGYWSLNHQQLANWYRGLNPNFYKAAEWSKSFFTIEVKSQGNWWCLAALVASVCWACLVWKSQRLKISTLTFNRKSAISYATIALIGIILSIIASKHSAYATDEIFSALNFASIPLFQGFSYYALPNNHILFNFINRLFFFWTDNLVLTGRIISLCCYVIALWASWYFIGKFVRSNWLKSGMIIVLALEFPVWGFSGQARGYELSLMLSVLSFITFWDYWVDKNTDSLTYNAIFNVGAILTIPTYLYWWVGLVFAALLFMVWNRRLDWHYIRVSFTSACMTLILSLPFLSFSGFSALADNRWIKTEDFGMLNFLLNINGSLYFNGLFNEWFCFFSKNILFSLGIVLIPFILIFYATKDIRYRSIIIVYLSIIVSFVFIAVITRKLPFYRNLIAHSFIAMLFILIALLALLSTRNLRICFGILLLAAIPYFAYTNYKRMPENLYYYGVTSYYNKLYQSKTIIKPQSTVYLDDESFFWWYVLKTKYPEEHIKVEYHESSFNHQDYCIVPVNSSIPCGNLGYKLVEVCDDFNIFERVDNQ